MTGPVWSVGYHLRTLIPSSNGMDRISAGRVISAVLTLLLVACAGSYAGAAVVPKDFLGGLGDFEWSADTQYVAGYPSWHSGCKAASENDSVAAGWLRETGSGVDPHKNIVYRIEPGGISGSNCQYFALKNIRNGKASASLVKSVRIGDKDCEPNRGDWLTFTIDRMWMHGFDGVDAVCKLRIRFHAKEGKGSVWAEDVVLPQSKTPFRARMTARVPQSVTPGDDSSKIVRATLWITIRTSGDFGAAEPGICVDGAHLYVDRDGNGVLETENVPVETDRMIRTFMIFYDPREHDPRDTVQNYDFVMIQNEQDYPEALRLKYYRPDVRVYLYEAVSVTDWRYEDKRGKQQDARYSNSPIGFKYVLDNHPEWLYPDPSSANDKYDMKSPPFLRLRQTTRHYFTHLDNPEYQEAWVTRTVDKATRYRMDGVWIDALEVANAVSYTHLTLPTN